jgi:DnaJ family protein B protein 11
MSLFFFLSAFTTARHRDFYEILGLRHDCTDREIEKVFMRLSRKYHPDKNKGDPQAADKYADINDAYGVLRDPNKRRVYDLWGEDGVRLYEAPKLDQNRPIGAPQFPEDSISAQVRVKGRTLRVTFPVDLIDFHRGGSYELAVTRRTMCRCPDIGFTCEKCRGRPTVQENVSLKLVVEKGSDEGTVVVFPNAGDVSEQNAPGDIEVVLVSRKHPVFRRSGSDLHMNVSISLREALLGFTREVEHIDGSKLVVESKALIQCQQTIVIKGRGLAKYLFPGEFGDVVVHPALLWPKALDPEKRAKLVKALTPEAATTVS